MILVMQSSTSNSSIRYSSTNTTPGVGVHSSANFFIASKYFPNLLLLPQLLTDSFKLFQSYF